MHVRRIPLAIRQARMGSGNYPLAFVSVPMHEGSDSPSQPITSLGEELPNGSSNLRQVQHVAARMSSRSVGRSLDTSLFGECLTYVEAHPHLPAGPRAFGKTGYINRLPV